MGNNLKQARTREGLTQVKVAKLANVSIRAYQYHELGKKTPSVLVAIRIARILNTTVEELFDVATGQASSLG